MQRRLLSPSLRDQITKMPSAREAVRLAEPPDKISETDPERDDRFLPIRIRPAPVFADSAVETQDDDEEEDAAERRSPSSASQLRQRDGTGRNPTPDIIFPSKPVHERQIVRRTCRATRKLASWTFASQSEQRKAESDGQ